MARLTAPNRGLYVINGFNLAGHVTVSYKSNLIADSWNASGRTKLTHELYMFAGDQIVYNDDATVTLVLKRQDADP